MSSKYQLGEGQCELPMLPDKWHVLADSLIPTVTGSTSAEHTLQLLSH